VSTLDEAKVEEKRGSTEAVAAPSAPTTAASDSSIPPPPPGDVPDFSNAPPPPPPDAPGSAPAGSESKTVEVKHTDLVFLQGSPFIRPYSISLFIAHLIICF
jgi:hypothetical protein